MPDAPDIDFDLPTNKTPMQYKQSEDKPIPTSNGSANGKHNGQADTRSGSAMRQDEGSEAASAEAARNVPAFAPLPASYETLTSAVSPPVSLQWEQALECMPLGVAVLEGGSGKTLWTNAALRRLLIFGAGLEDVLDWQPHEYLPNLEPAIWDKAQAGVLQAEQDDDARQSRRLQFVHHATRNIAYWEWTVQRLQSPDNAAPRLLLTVQNVTDVVMNERQLATAVRTSQQARRDSEALSSLAQLLNQSLTTPDLLRTVVHAAAAYFDTPHASVLLLDENGQHFKVGYSIGLQSILDGDAGEEWATGLKASAAGFPEDAKRGAGLQCAATLAGKSIAQRKTLVTTYPAEQGVKTPTLSDGKMPATLVTSPIHQNGHTYGVVEVYFSQAREIRDDSLSLLSTFADQTAVGLLKADLYEQIAMQRGQLQSIFDNAPVGILYFDAQGVVVTANAAAARSYGFEEEGSAENASARSLVGQQGATLLPDLPAPVFEAALRGKAFHASHLVTRRAGGREVVYDVSLIPVTTPNATSGLLLLTFEVTELVSARQEADHARQDAEDALAAVRATQSQMVQMEKMRAVGELAQGVAHDINNALMAVLGYTELA